jgi:ATP-dependent RNA helicase DHX8/PRP22
VEKNTGITDRTLSEFIIELSKGKSSVKEFRVVLHENGADIPDTLVETLWGIIQLLMPGKNGGRGGVASGKLQPRPDAPFAGLALPDTRDRVKVMEEEMLAEARAKADTEAAAQRQHSHEQASTREGRSNGRGGADDGERRGRDDRDRRQRSRSPDRGGRRQRSRSRERERGRGGGYRGRSRSASPRGRREEKPLPDEPEMYGVYRVSV